MSKSFDVNKYFIMGTINCKRDPLRILEEALQAGITIFQLREKGKDALKGKAYIEFAMQCQRLCKQYSVPFIVNDDVELALTLEADGIHVGQDDAKIEAFRRRAANKIVGLSVHTIGQLEQAMANGADYVGVGPIYSTATKADARPPAGVAFLKEARLHAPHFPIVAIGGITPENSPIVRQAGANGVAVISAITHSEFIEKTIKLL